MAPRTEFGVPAARPAPLPSRAALRAASPGGLGWLAAFLTAALLYLGSPLTRGELHPPLWAPAAGAGLVFVAWFGWRLALFPLAGGGTGGWLGHVGLSQGGREWAERCGRKGRS